jgi:PEP-CTERM motif
MKSKRVYSFALWLGLAAMLIFPGAASASLVAPGTTLPPDIFSPCPGCTLDASLNSGPITVTNAQGITMTFDVVSAVYSDPSNPFGAGDLDFVIQVTNVSGNDLIGRVTAGVFSGFMTDVGFTATGSALPGGLFVDGTQAPQLVSRSPVVPNNGATVGFIYDGLAPSTFAPGTTSTALIIQTDAMNFTAGNVNVIDDVTGSTAGFEPAVVTPEPSSAILMLLGVGLGFVTRKRIGIGQHLPQAS